MSEDVGTCKESSKDERIKKEIDKLSGIFTNIDGDRKEAIKPLIESAAFMAVTLRDLERAINEKGCISEYQNGENQWGTKKSPEVEIYNTMVKNHAAVVKQLTDLLPKSEPIEAEDEFDKFLKKRD